MADLRRLAAVCGVGRHPRCATLASVGEHAFLPRGGPHGGGICVLRAGGEVILGGGRCGGVHDGGAWHRFTDFFLDRVFDALIEVWS
jgi:hypothetical protein